MAVKGEHHQLLGAKFEKLSPEGLKRAALKRQSYFDLFDKAGVRYASGNRSKPYTGSLSPGCLTCLRGTWSCLYINRLCTRHCFYCPQDRTISEEHCPETENHFSFDSAGDYIDYLKRFHFEGIGFSGGEPFLVFDRLLEYITEIRRVFGSRHYLWVYTNGDLLTGKHLQLLQGAGLNELRIDIAGNNYGLEPVALAAEHMDTVTVEIPAIPEDLDLVKGILPALEETGVRFINVHQLFMNRYNSSEFSRRGYSLAEAGTKRRSFSVLESELAALELLKQAVEAGLKPGMNYCSECYKERFYGRAFRRRYSSVGRQSWESVTDTGFIRRLSLEDSREELSLLRDAQPPEDRGGFRMMAAGGKVKLAFHPRHLAGMMEVEKFRSIHVNYYTPRLRSPRGSRRGDRRFPGFGSEGALVDKVAVHKLRLSNKTAAVFFHKLFVEGKDPDQACVEVMGLYGLDEGEKGKILGDLTEFRRQFETVEYIPADLPAYE
jgi:pyruvate formate-lyase activating enzyme-like uncharacterized protein